MGRECVGSLCRPGVLERKACSESREPERLALPANHLTWKSQIFISCRIRMIFKLAWGQSRTRLNPSIFETQYYFLWRTNISPVTWSVPSWHTGKLARVKVSLGVFHVKIVYYIQAERRWSLLGNWVPNGHLTLRVSSTSPFTPSILNCLPSLFPDIFFPFLRQCITIFHFQD